jgi:hypothetical protein
VYSLYEGKNDYCVRIVTNIAIYTRWLNRKLTYYSNVSNVPYYSNNNNHYCPHIKNTQLIYNNTNNKNIFYHYIFYKTYTHTILISLKHVFNQAYNILPKLAIDSKGNTSSTLTYCFKPNGQITYHSIVHNVSQNHNDLTVRSP